MSIFLFITGVLCTFGGLWFTARTLQSLISARVALITIAVLFFGTNLFQLTISQDHPVHSFLFGLFAFFLWLNLQWSQSPKWKFLLLMILSLGLIGFLHPIALIVAVIPVLWGVHDPTSSREKWTRVLSARWQYLAFLAFMSLFIILCCYPWFTRAGHELYFDPGSLDNYIPVAPYLRVFLLSFKKGWFVYSPLMIFAIAGFYFLADRNRPVFFALFFSFLSYLFIAASWPAWWYGDSFGQRSMIEAYAILALPLGYLIGWLTEKRLAIKIPAFLIIGLLILLNLFQTWQYQRSIIHPSRMTSHYYAAVFGQLKVPGLAGRYLEPLPMAINDIFPGEASMALKQKISYDFETPIEYYESFRDTTHARNGRFGIRMEEGLRYSPGIRLKFKELTQKDKLFIRVRGYIYFTHPKYSAKVSLVATCYHKENTYKYRAIHCETSDAEPDRWNRITLDYETPPIIDTEDEVLIFFWYRGDREVFLDDLEISIYEPKE